MKPGLSADDKRYLIGLAEEAIDTYLDTGRRSYPDSDQPLLTTPMGVFVTLKRMGQLRGCIGYPLPVKPLVEAVVDNAIAAASEDPRFPPVTPGELEDLEIEISVLTPPVEVDGPEEVTVGRDGIIISKGPYRGLLLPQVPVEQGWNREQFLRHGCMKAGLPGDQWNRDITIEVFQAEVFSRDDLSSQGPGKECG